MTNSRKTILVTDDDAGIRNSFADYLEDHDYIVLTAENGVEGLKSFNLHHPDLVLLDLRMPKMGGLEMLKALEDNSSDIPLIVVSGTGHINDVVEALHLGAWDYLLKPVEDLSVLGHMIQKSLERAQLRQDTRDYQKKLEQQVKERTVELEQANQSLLYINQRLRKIVDSTSSLSSCLDLEELGVRLLYEFALHMEATGGSLFLVEETLLRLLRAIDPGHAPVELPFPLEENSVLCQVIKQREPVLLTDLEDLNELESSGLEGYANGSALIFPILDENGIVAAVLALHNKHSSPFAEQDKEIGMILASYCGESIRAIRTFKALSESEKRYRGLSDMLPQAICETDSFGKITYANLRAYESFGYTEEDLKPGLTIADMIAPEDRERVIDNVTSMMQEGIARVSGTEYKALRKDGNVFPVLVYSTPILQDGTPVGILIVAVDITHLKKQEEVIIHQAHFDSLTKLPNRFLSLDRLSQLLLNARRADTPVAVFFLDLDDFKKINDSLGHEVGDQLLVQVANRLNNSLREADTIGRLGGDEFIVLLGGISEGSDAKSVAENLLNNIRKPFFLDNRELFLTASIGVAIFPNDGETPAELLRSADTAMYSAKAEGGNEHHFFTNLMKEEVSHQLKLEQYMHGALTNEEFHLCYQPIIALPGKTVIGFEALLRWSNPELGNLSPEEFIPIAERTGLIVSIGEFVIDEALTVLSKIHKKYGPSFKMAVNLSPQQFRNPLLLKQISSALKQSAIPPRSLELEITEGVFMGGLSNIDKTLMELKNIGVGISMDDFGTGYSSLSYLRKYPFDVLKIDKSFVFDMEEDSQACELVNVVIAMAHSLNLSVVGEGVETEAQLNHLVKQGCDQVQGYLFSRPLPIEEIYPLIEQNF